MTTRQPVSAKSPDSAQNALRWLGPLSKSWSRKRTKPNSSHLLKLGNSFHNLIVTIPDGEQILTFKSSFFFTSHGVQNLTFWWLKYSRMHVNWIRWVTSFLYTLLYNLICFSGLSELHIFKVYHLLFISESCLNLIFFAFYSWLLFTTWFKICKCFDLFLQKTILQYFTTTQGTTF